MQDVVDQVVQNMAKLRRRYPKDLKKVRIDRLSKIVPGGTNFAAFLHVFIKDPRIKQVQKQGEDGKLYPAAQLTFKAFQEEERKMKRGSA